MVKTGASLALVVVLAGCSSGQPEPVLVPVLVTIQEEQPPPLQVARAVTAMEWILDAPCDEVKTFKKGDQWFASCFKGGLRQIDIELSQLVSRPDTMRVP